MPTTDTTTAPLSFTTPKKDQKNTPSPITFDWDGRTVTARCPKKAMWARLATCAAPGSSDAEKAYAFGVFGDVCLSGADAAWLESRLRDLDDDLDYEDVSKVINTLIETWSPDVNRAFAAMGSEAPGPNRAQRRTKKA
ncbi:hypothetical protein [Streptomyces sp. NBC_01304]|uniref:hypothetical protein n=1 Tax=Streptomyces sp. NBC_01304 TaxID=2903818 RepID=UPI002E1057B7|nr:hypothetical protein OG430_44740 [Streptomyces sp. NBC_01304]